MFTILNSSLDYVELYEFQEMPLTEKKPKIRQVLRFVVYGFLRKFWDRKTKSTLSHCATILKIIFACLQKFKKYLVQNNFIVILLHTILKIKWK